SSLFLVQNFILTYFADYLPMDVLLEQIGGAQSSSPGATTGGSSGGGTGQTGGAQTAEPDEGSLLADFAGSQVPSSMLVNLAPEMHGKTASKTKDYTTTGNASRYFAATINEQRNAWLSDRNFDAAV